MKIAALLWLIATSAVAAEPDLHGRVAAVYGFRLADLDDAGREAKSAQLDVFWNDVKTLGPEGLAQLRAELRRDDAPPFFYFDGTQLLLSLSERADDLTLAASALARADLADVEPSSYFHTLHHLAVNGRNTTAAAMKILAEPDFQVFVPAHALTLDQTSSLLYLLLPMEPSLYVPAAIGRLSAETDLTAQRSLIFVLAYTVDNAADQAVRRFAADPTKSAQARAVAADFVKLIGSKPDIGTGPKLAGLRKQRRELLARVSDEAIDEAMALTAQMRRHRRR